MTVSKFHEELRFAVSAFLAEMVKATGLQLSMADTVVKKQNGPTITVNDIVDGFAEAHANGIVSTKEICELCGDIASGEPMFVQIREIAKSVGMDMKGRGKEKNALKDALAKMTANNAIDARKAALAKIQARRAKLDAEAAAAAAADPANPDNLS